MISVILPVRDGEAWIAECLRSLLEQTEAPGEILVGDDGSRDSTAAIVESLGSPSIRVVATERSRGISRTCNDLVAQARGRYIARMDADDVAIPRRFEVQLREMKANGHTVVGTWARRFGASGTLHAPPSGHDGILAQMGLSCPFVNPTVMVDREGLGTDPLYRPETTFAADYELFASLRGRARFANVPEVLLLWRQHSRNVGTDPRTLAIQNATVSCIRRGIWKECGIELTDAEEDSLDALVFGTPPDSGSAGLLVSSFRKALDAAGNRRLWAPVSSVRDLFQSQWEYYCRVSAWGNPAIVPIWWNGVRALGGVPVPMTFAVLVAKSLLGRRNSYLSRLTHPFRESSPPAPGASRGIRR